MLEVDKISLRRFMSFGDDDTALDIGDLGPCLIVGEIAKEGEEEPVSERMQRSKRSNGAGKSALTNALLWCMFGRTMHEVQPGDDVINWHIGGPCTVSTTLRNGDVVTRSRSKGSTDLSVVGEHESMFATRSTPQNEQKKLAKLYGLDWEIFCSSVFCTQFGKPWLDLADTTRKQIIERVLHVDRFSCYAGVAKEFISKVDGEQKTIRSKYESLKESVVTVQQDIATEEERADEFERSRNAKQEADSKEVERLKRERDNIPVIDLGKLETQWGIIDKLGTARGQFVTEANAVAVDIQVLTREIQSLAADIADWQARGGTTCVACDQTITVGYVSDEKIAPRRQRLDEKQVSVSKLREKKTGILDKAKLIDVELVKHSPEYSLKEANALMGRRQHLDKTAKDTAARAVDRGTEVNPHLTRIEELKKRLDKTNEDLKEFQATVAQYDYISRHYSYIHRKYNDRREAKSHVVAEYLPFFNGRLRHYLGRFELDVGVELTEALAIKTNKWKHKYLSGGERNSVNMAFMFSMFDLHEELYGRQCNVMVLDEVDGRLDEANVENFVDIVTNDIAQKVETILVISHRNLMRDLFPHQITVRRDKNRISSIAEIR